MMRTDCRRPASAEFASIVPLAQFCLLIFGACFVVGAQAADNVPAVIPPKPVVLQPTTVMAPPPAAPTAAENTPQPVVKKGARAAKTTKAVTKHKSVKPTGKPKPKAKHR